MEARRERTFGFESAPTGVKTVLCVILARGGSKNAPFRNLRLLAGKPLLAYTAETALAAARLSRVVLSTDDEDVADAGCRCGLEPYPRSIQLSRENTPVQRVIQDAVRRFEKAGEPCDAVCILDPDSPFRRPEDIDWCIELLERSGADSVATVVPVPPEYHPHTVYFQAPDGSLRLSTGAAAGASEELPPAFYRDGSVYVVRRDFLMNGNSLFGERTVGYVVDPVRLVKLDRPEDWGRAERIAKLGTRQATAARIAPLARPRLNLPAGWRAMPVADPLIGAGPGLLKEGALGSLAIARGKYLELLRRAVLPCCRVAEMPCGIREVLLPPGRKIVGHEFLDPIPPALVVPRSMAVRVPSVSRIEDPFRPHSELLPETRAAEAPLVAALSGWRLRGSGFEPAHKPGRREIPGGSQVQQVAAPIHFTGRLGNVAGHVRPVRRFMLAVAELRSEAANRPQIRPLPQPLPALALFRAGLLFAPASGDFRAREQLVYAPALRRKGLWLAQPGRAGIPRIELLNTYPVELPGARPLVFAHPVAPAPLAVVRSRARERAAMRLARGWELFGQASELIVCGSTPSHVDGIAWPTAKTFVFARQLGLPVNMGKRAKLGLCQMQVFPLPAAGLPSSAGPQTRLPGARLAKMSPPSIRLDARTLASAAPLACEFRGSGKPNRRPGLHAILRVALMPKCVFLYIDIEDQDDYGTWKRAPHYAADAPAPLVPDSDGVRSRAVPAVAGYKVVCARPCLCNAPGSLAFGELPFAPAVALADRQAGIIGMDFAAIAAARSPRWRLSFK